MHKGDTQIRASREIRFTFYRASYAVAERIY